MMKKILIVLLCGAMLLTAAACTPGGEENEPASAPDFNVEAVATEGDAVSATAADLLAIVMEAEETEFELVEGAFVSVGGFANTETSGWQFYCDGAPADELPGATPAVAGVTYSLVWDDLPAAPAE